MTCLMNFYYEKDKKKSQTQKQNKKPTGEGGEKTKNS